MLHQYFALGQHDLMVISEMPNAQAASMISLVAAAGGGIENAVLPLVEMLPPQASLGLRWRCC